MKAVILAGGLGTRLAEETSLRPKPMVEIGGRPILWHIMKAYSAYGINDFVICCGYRGYMIKEYFANYFLHLSEIDLKDGIGCHLAHGKSATVAAVEPPGRYGALDISDDRVTGFSEKPRGDGGLINGGFFVLSPDCINLIDGDDTTWEAGPLEQLANHGELVPFVHRGFWQPMDTLRERNLLEELWESGEAPWRVW